MAKGLSHIQSHSTLLICTLKSQLSHPLLVLNRSRHKDAKRIFKIIQRIMGDRDRDRPGMLRMQSDGGYYSSSEPSNSRPNSASPLVEEEKWLLSEGLTHGELRDEIYCQLVKQLSGNPSPYVHWLKCSTCLLIPSQRKCL